jgi:NAD(P)-dependent dehydrogenase (short-subunit alcohol dehydrogenase family)
MGDTTFYQVPFNVVLAGSSGAIGQAFLAQLLALPNTQRVYSLSRSSQPIHSDARVHSIQCDLNKDDDLQALSNQLKADSASINLLINATGLLHSESIRPEKALSQLKRSSLEASFAVNAFAPILLIQAVLPCLDKQRAAWIASLSARVGSIEDNRLGGWFSYRAAKAAQNQLFKTASIELKRSHPLATCLQLHPGTVDSNLSAPFQSGVANGKLFTPQQSAAYLLAVIASKSPTDTGTFWDWNNVAIAW